MLKLLKSEFIKNAATLATGTLIAQAIPVLISPILTRIYSPAEFGSFALFLSISAVLTTIVNGKYEMAIVLPKSDNDALQLTKLAASIGVLISLIVLLIVVLFNSQIVQLLNANEIKYWLYGIPLVILIVGIYNVLNFYNIRNKKYVEVSKSNVTKSISLVLSQISLGFMGLGSSGLIIGQFISYFSGNFVLLKTIRPKFEYLKSVLFDDLIKIAKRYKKFPLFSLPGNLINSMTLNGTPMLISGIFGVSILGFYSLAIRLLGSPTSIIGNSLGQVYFQQASKVKAGGGSISKLFLRTLYTLSIISVSIFSVLYFIVEPLFTFIFGEDWAIAGTYAKILIPLVAVRFVSSTLSNTLTILEKQEWTFVINGILFTTTLLIFYFGNLKDLSFMQVLWILSLFMSGLYFSFILFYYYLVKRR